MSRFYCVQDGGDGDCLKKGERHQFVKIGESTDGWMAYLKCAKCGADRALLVSGWNNWSSYQMVWDDYRSMEMRTTKNAPIVPIFASMIMLSGGFDQPMDRSLCTVAGSSDIQQSVCGIGDILGNASGYYVMDLEQGVEYDIQVSHVSSTGVFVMRDPSGRVVKSYEWENPPYGGMGMLLEASSSGIYSLEIEGVCHVQVSRYLWMMVGEDAITLTGVLDEKRSVYGYYIWIFQSGAEHASDLVEVEVKIKAPEGADFNLYKADMFFTEPFPAEDRRVEDREETLVPDNGPEGLLLFVQRASGEGEYTFTVRTYIAHWKALPRLAAIVVVISLAILGVIVLSWLAGKKERMVDCTRK